MRAVYVLLTYLLAPIVIALEGWKALWNADYRGRLHQRLRHRHTGTDGNKVDTGEDFGCQCAGKSPDAGQGLF